MCFVEVTISSLDLDNGKIEKHKFSYICPEEDCKERFKRYVTFEKHLLACHEQSVADYDSSSFIYDEKVSVFDKKNSMNSRGKNGKNIFKRVSKSLQAE